ncbi:MAG: hypothetical protein WBW53_08635 [Terriglobales bacterium]
MIAAMISAAGAGLVSAQSTPTATAVGPWRTGVAVTCPNGTVIPAHTVISGPDVTAAQLCGSNSSSSISTGGAMISNTGNFQQDLVTNATNLFIVSHTTNPVVSSFMQGAATGFISSMFANNAEAERQQQLMAVEILRRQQEQDEQRRIAAQQRFDAMFARLAGELKLEGLPFGLSLKGMNSPGPDSLQLKGMSSPGPDDLKLKISDASPTAYGLKGLPGIYVGGPAGGDSTSANTTGQAATPNPNLVSGPGTGTTGAGIPGLPGIYLDSVQPSQAVQVAQAAENLQGPDRDLAQDVALHAADNNPALTASSEDPGVQNFQQANQDYKQALAANNTASQEYQTAQTHVETDQSALDVAKSQLAAIQPSIQQQAAYDKMIAAANSDQQAAMLARQNFDSTEIHLSAARDHAATALAQTSSPMPNVAPTPTSRVALAQTVPSRSSNTVNLSQVSQPIAAPVLRSAAQRGEPVLPPSASIMHPTDTDACLAAANHSSTLAGNRPTVAQLRAQLDIAKESLARLLETHMRESDDRADWANEMKKSGLDIGYQAFDLTAKFVLGHYADSAQEEADWAEKGMERTQDALSAETNLARQSSLEAEVAAYRQAHADAEQAHEILEGAKEGSEQFAGLRDLRGYINEHPIEESAKGSILPTLEGIKQLVKIGLSQEKVQETLERWAANGLKAGEIVPFVDRTVTIGGAFIDTGYDLTVEYLGFHQLQQADENSELFYRGAIPLQKKIRVTVDQLKCYQ